MFEVTHFELVIMSVPPVSTFARFNFFFFLLLLKTKTSDLQNTEKRVELARAVVYFG